MLRIHELKLNIKEGMGFIPLKLEKKLSLKKGELLSWEVVKESVDARDKRDIHLVYTVDFSATREDLLIKKKGKLKLEKAPDLTYQDVTKGMSAEEWTSRKKMMGRPVVAGFGPCGMFAALLLSEMGYCPIVVERGKAIDDRIADVDAFWEKGILNEESNVQFGEGGAGAFSDGKLTTQIKDYRVRKVLRDLVASGADPKILYKQKPHIGTDVLRSVVKGVREKIIENGGQVLFESRLESLVLEQDGSGEKLLKAVRLSTPEGEREIEASVLILALGHSARDTVRQLYSQGLEMQQKPFSMGVRIEHPQRVIDQAQFGDSHLAEQLGAADYKLSYHCRDGRGVYTFCMCPGGYVIASASREGMVVTNGMSYSDRGGENANSALLVSVGTADFPSEDPLSGMELQETYERLAFLAGGADYRAPAQRVGAFLSAVSGEKAAAPQSGSEEDGANCQPTYKPGVRWTSLSQCLPDFVVDAMGEAIPALGRKLKGFDHPESVMTGIETRSSSPVRIVRDERQEGTISGVYPAGEGAGYAGGIVSAAVDGMKAAEEVAKGFQPPEKKYKD